MKKIPNWSQEYRMPGADPVYGRLPYWDDPAGYRRGRWNGIRRRSLQCTFSGLLQQGVKQEWSTFCKVLGMRGSIYLLGAACGISVFGVPFAVAGSIISWNKNRASAYHVCSAVWISGRAGRCGTLVSAVSAVYSVYFVIFTGRVMNSQ